MENTNKKSIEFCGTTVYYGKTTLRKFLSDGYSIDNKKPAYHEESTTLMVGFFKNGEYLGELAFFDIKEELTLQDIYDRPIDTVLLENEPRRPKKKSKRKPTEKPLSQGRMLAKQIRWTCLMHLCLAVIYTIAYIIPSLFKFIRDTNIGRKDHEYTLGIFFVCIPPMISMLIWINLVTKGTRGKIIYSILLIFNTFFPWVYLYLIGYYLNQLFPHIIH